MKKLNVFIILFVTAFAAFMTSCDKEPVNVAAPSIEMITNDTVIVPGAGITIKGNIYAPGNIGTITYYKNGDVYGTPVTSGFDTDTTTYFEVQFSNVTEGFTFQVKVEDLQKEPKTGESSVITVSLDDLIVKKSDLKIYCAVGDQTGNQIFASLTPDFGTYKWSDADGHADIIAMIDVMYYNGNYTKDGEHPRLVSPDATPLIVNSGETLAGANTTKFKVLEGTELALFSDWASIDDDTEIKTITNITDDNTLTLALNDVIAFELENGKKGVIKVKSWTPGWGRDDYIMLDVIVQKQDQVK